MGGMAAIIEEIDPPGEKLLRWQLNVYRYVKETMNYSQVAFLGSYSMKCVNSYHITEVTFDLFKYKNKFYDKSNAKVFGLLD